MSWFTRWLEWKGSRGGFTLHGAAPRARPAKAFRPRARLGLEALEDRLAPANVFVVPLDTATDGAHFHTLSSALLAAGTNGTVTVEPGSTADTTAVNINQAGVTVTGDKNVPPTILPRYDINVAANNVALRNLNLGTVTMGGGINSTILTKSLVVNLTELASVSGNGSSVVTFNIFSGAVALGGNTNGTAVNDFVANNTFASLAPVMLGLSSSAGDMIKMNQFTGDVTGQIAIQMTDTGTAAAMATIGNNTIKLFGVSSAGITASQVGGQTWANILVNSIQTNSAGTGLLVTMNTTASLRLNVQGNDFHNNLTGISISGDGGSAAVNVDVGGGIFNSLGANNFRSYTATGTATSAAIFLTNTGGGVFARQNLWANGVNPNTVIDDATHGAATGTGNIDTSSPLSSQRSFVQALYNEVLGRSGSLAELDSWVGVLSTSGQAAVVNGILRSKESLGRIVNSYYVRFLNRNADTNGKASWVSFLQNGGNLEGLTTGFVTSPEYINRVGVDFVQSLFINLFNRTGSTAEVAGWNNQIQSLGLTGIANGFSFSQEYRTIYVTSFYLTFLHRTPSAAEVSGVVAMSGDILSLQAFILSSPEYFTNG